uniref:Uncharacterized protein n=1 Tax=Arundo donax TaxID=35708 RepID=A0A0A8ZNK8_ARUDO
MKSKSSSKHEICFVYLYCVVR